MRSIRGREVEGHDVHVDTDLLQVFLNQGGHALAGFVSGVRDDRENDGISVFVFQRAVLQSEALGSAAISARHRMSKPAGFSLALNQNLFAGETGPTAGCACPRNTTRARSSRLIAWEMARRKCCGAEPVLLVRRQRSLCDFVEPHLLAVERRSGVVHDLRRCRRQLVEVFAVERIDQVDFVALEAQHLDVAVGLNIELDRIEIGQLASLRVASSNSSDFASAAGCDPGL